LNQERLSLLVERYRLELSLGEHTNVVDPLSALVADHPLVEPLAGLHLLALYRCGRQTDALELYTRTRQRLVDALGDEPGAELRQLHKQILRRDPALDLTTGGASTTVTAAGPAPEPAPAQLPPDIAAFAGRTAALARLDALLADRGDAPGAAVISAVGGAAGVGKTALAVHWAHRVADQFPDGQLYVNLRGFDPGGSPVAPSDAIRSFLDALSVPPARVPAGLEAQVGLYRSLLAGRQMLLVLDNALNAAQVRPLLPGAPGCLVVVTSRNRLSSLVVAEGARPVTLDLLTHAEARQLLQQRLGADRVTAEPAATDEIIARCARLPLALAIVAARAAVQPHFPLHAFAKELAEAGDGLEPWSDPDAVADLRAVFSWSYRALPAHVARLFRLLGLHPGPDLSASAAASLAGTTAPQARRQLTELAQAHLITQSAPGRYRFHDLLRAYATELAGTVDSDADRHAATRRMLDAYLHTAHRAAMLLYPHRQPIVVDPPRPGAQPEGLDDQASALAWLTREHPVLLAASTHAAAIGSDPHVWQLAWSLTDYHQRQGRWRDWEATQTNAVAAAGRLGDRSAQAVAHASLARALIYQQRYDDAYPHLQHSLDQFRRLDDLAGLARTHLSVTLMFAQQGRHHDALAHAQQGLALNLKLDNRTGQAQALNGIGWLHAQLGHHRDALHYCHQALALHKEIGDRPGEASCWDSIGCSHHRLGEHEQAASCYWRALELVRAHGDRYNEAGVLNRLGDTHHAAGEPDAARAAWQAALDIYQELDDPTADEVRDKLNHLPEP
jgi:tetratricopeptide (TPR) repeat protein